MTKALAKVHKKVSKKKSHLNSLHEHSRDAKKLRRAGARSERVDDLKARRLRANDVYSKTSSHQGLSGSTLNFLVSADRTTFFQSKCRAALEPLEDEAIHGLVYRCFDSLHLELEQH